MKRPTIFLVGLVAVMALLSASCGSDGNNSDELGAEDLYGVWQDEDGVFTLEFSEDDSTLLFTSPDFDACESTYEHRVDEGEVHLDLECGSEDGSSEASLSEGENAAELSSNTLHKYLSASWELQSSPSATQSMGGAGELAAGEDYEATARGITLETGTEDDSSTVSYKDQIGVVFLEFAL